MKKFFIIAAVAAASIFGLVKANDVNVNNNMSELQMENVELLAEGEPNPNCINGCKENGDECFCYRYYFDLKEGNL